MCSEVGAASLRDGEQYTGNVIARNQFYVRLEHMMAYAVYGRMRCGVGRDVMSERREAGRGGRDISGQCK